LPRCDIARRRAGFVLEPTHPGAVRAGGADLGSTWLVIKDQIGSVPAGWSVTWRFAVAAVGVAGAGAP
jgi:hypothetical protein